MVLLVFISGKETVPESAAASRRHPDAASSRWRLVAKGSSCRTEGLDPPLSKSVMFVVGAKGVPFTVSSNEK
jgi:hypothetical protein